MASRIEDFTRRAFTARPSARERGLAETRPNVDLEEVEGRAPASAPRYAAGCPESSSVVRN
jgi:hypothetical protein